MRPTRLASPIHPSSIDAGPTDGPMDGAWTGPKVDVLLLGDAREHVPFSRTSSYDRCGHGLHPFPTDKGGSHRVLICKFVCNKYLNITILIVATTIF